MNEHPSTSPHRPGVVVVAPAAVTWECLRYAGEQGTKAVFYALRPGSKVQVRVEYDRATGQATSHPDTPELTACALFAVLVLDEHAALRTLRATEAVLAGLVSELTRRVATNPADERLRARLAACQMEARKRAAQGPTLRETLAQPDSTARRQAVRALTSAELFGE